MLICTRFRQDKHKLRRSFTVNFSIHLCFFPYGDVTPLLSGVKGYSTFFGNRLILQLPQS